MMQKESYEDRVAELAEDSQEQLLANMLLHLHEIHREVRTGRYIVGLIAGLVVVLTALLVFGEWQVQIGD